MRQRRNRTTTSAQLVAEELLEIPDLPVRGRKKWHLRTLAWWDNVRRSPMAAEYLEADLDGLYILADLVDQYWKAPSVKLAAEINRHRQCFGLTPIDRRRLQWEVQRVEAAQKRPPAPSRKRAKGDPRELLRVVS